MIVLVALPAAAEFTTYNSSIGTVNWYDPLSNFTIVTFDGMTPSTCAGSSGCNTLPGMLSGLFINGFQGVPASTNTYMLIVAENDATQTFYNYGGTGPTGSAVANPRLLRSDAANGTNQIGFHIVLPAAVTAFGLQVMSYSSGTAVSVRIGGVALTTALGPYPTGTVTTTGIPHRSFIGITSPTSFQTIDIVSAPGDQNKILIDNIAFGTLASAAADTAEPQTALYIATGLGMILLARRMKNQRVSSAAILQ